MRYTFWIPTLLSIANDAANAILDIYRTSSYEIKKKSDKSPVTKADVDSHHIIEKGLQSIDPDIPILSEEGVIVPYAIRSTWSRYWLVDPLDGTRDFIDQTNEFSINIALIENNQPVLGIIVVPAYKEVYWATLGGSAYCQIDASEPRLITVDPVIETIPLKVAASRRAKKNSGPQWEGLMERLQNPLVTYSGSALKFCRVASGKAHVYPQWGPTAEWDTAAGQCILEAAGGAVTDFKGRSLRYNTKEALENPPFYAVATRQLTALCCG